MDYNQCANVSSVLHWNYRGFTEFPLHKLQGEEADVIDIYLKENLISRIPGEICKLSNLESLYLSGNDITELPREISKLRSLKCLDISGNRLRYIPEEIADAKNLKFLILDENELKRLPLRLAELRMLRYLSVCDNKLEWLPQRPVFNYHHCELRFWRNADLRTIPYSLWNHMFRDQQTRSLNIGCLDLTSSGEISNRKYFKIIDNNRKHEVTIKTPYNYDTILTGNNQTPPSLFELSKRKFYKILCDIANKLNDRPVSIYSDHGENVNNNRIRKLEDKLDGISINEDSQISDVNGNYEVNRRNNINYFMRNRPRIYVPADIVRGYFDYLPYFIKTDLCNGPPSRCENITCKNPVFDFAYFEFCIEKIILIDSKEDVLLSAVFCSKLCADSWKSEKAALQWKLV
ncbi:unnamed protein product [Colias eurytheme]|nr:unnamed protein product [Colias eurytheme]